MTEPKFLRKPTPPKVKAAAAVSKAHRRAVRPVVQTIQAPQSKRSPTQALADLSSEWEAANLAHLAGTPRPESTAGELILRHLENKDTYLPATVEPFEVLDGESDPTTVSQDALVALHRKDLASTRGIVMRLIAELDFITDHMTLFETIADVLAKPGDETAEALRREFHKVSSYPNRVAMAKQLSDTLKALVPLERQAGGLIDGYVDAASERRKKESAAVATVVSTSYDGITGKFSQVMAKFQKSG